MKVESEPITVIDVDTQKSKRIYGIDIDLTGLFFSSQQAADLTASRIREAIESSLPFSVEV